MKIRPEGAEAFRAVGHADRYDEIGRFSQVCERTLKRNCQTCYVSDSHVLYIRIFEWAKIINFFLILCLLDRASC